MTINPRKVLSIIVACFLLPASVLIAKENSKPSGLFSDASEMHITLSGPWSKIQRNYKKDHRYPVQLVYTGADGVQHTIEAEVAPRGITRRLRVCKFPPLKIYFNKKELKGTEFRGNKSLKLVTYCKANSRYEQYYIKEFLIYQIYNLVTEYSFRTKPMMIEYRDSDRSGSSISRFGFLIEDIDKVAKRNGFRKLKIARVPYNQFDPVQASNFSMFQYMIGNLDWAATDGPEENSCCHNSKIIGIDRKTNPKISIPYDFDASGLVNAHYAAPPNGLKLRNIRQRLFRGFCIHNDALPGAVELLKQKKPAILALFENNPHLTDRTRNDAIGYIESFYTTINNPKRFQKEIIGKCRGRK